MRRALPLRHLSLRAGPAHRSLTEAGHSPREDTGWSVGLPSAGSMSMARCTDMCGGVKRMNAGLTAVVADWKLGVRMLREHRAHHHRRAVAGGGHRDWGGRHRARRRTAAHPAAVRRRQPGRAPGDQDVAASRVEQRVLHDFAIRRRSLKTVTELGAARVSERNVLTGEGRVEALRVAEIYGVGVSAHPRAAEGRQAAAALGRNAGCGPGRGPRLRRLAETVPARPRDIGRFVTVGRTRRTVVGVMPPRFGFPRNQQLWVPLPVQDAPPREGPHLQVFGRLAGGASWQDAAAELEVVSARAAADQPATHAQLRTRVRAFAGLTPGDTVLLDWWSTSSSCWCWAPSARTSQR